MADMRQFESLAPASPWQEADIVRAIAGSGCNLLTIARSAGVKPHIVQAVLERNIAARIEWQSEAERCYEGFETAIRDTRGSLSKAAEKLGLRRAWLSAAINASPYLSSVLRECQEQLIDEAEQALWDGVRAGNRWSVRMVLMSEAAQARGWREGTQEIRHLIASSVAKWQLVDLSDEVMNEENV